MRRIVTFAALLATAGGATHGQQTAPADAPAPKAAEPGTSARMDQLLQAWAQRSAQTKTLDARYDRVDIDKVFQQETKYVGRAILQAPDLACLDLSKPAKAAGEKPEFYERIICTGQEVYHYMGPTKQIFIYPLGDGQGAKKKALEEGPLPFLFNMRVEEARKRYKMTLSKETQTHFLIVIVPLLDIDRESFSHAYVQLDKAEFLPSAMTLVEPSGKVTQNYTFTSIDRNGPIEPTNFQPLALRNWTTNDNRPGAKPGPAPTRAAEAQPTPAAQPKAKRR